MLLKKSHHHVADACFCSRSFPLPISTSPALPEKDSLLLAQRCREQGRFRTRVDLPADFAPAKVHVLARRRLGKQGGIR
jgi:hypothetical protein